MTAESMRQPHEEPSVRTRRVVAFALGFVGFAILLGGTLALYYRWITAGEKLTVALQDFPAPRLQPNPKRDWTIFHAAQVRALEGSGANGPAGTMTPMPIERAMAVVAARGAAAYDPVAGTPPYPGAGAGAAPLDGAPRAAPVPAVAPYGDVH